MNTPVTPRFSTIIGETAESTSISMKRFYVAKPFIESTVVSVTWTKNMLPIPIEKANKYKPMQMTTPISTP